MRGRRKKKEREKEKEEKKEEKKKYKHVHHLPCRIHSHLMRSSLTEAFFGSVFFLSLSLVSRRGFTITYGTCSLDDGDLSRYSYLKKRKKCKIVTRVYVCGLVASRKKEVVILSRWYGIGNHWHGAWSARVGEESSTGSLSTFNG